MISLFYISTGMKLGYSVHERDKCAWKPSTYWQHADVPRRCRCMSALSSETLEDSSVRRLQPLSGVDLVLDKGKIKADRIAGN